MSIEKPKTIFQLLSCLFEKKVPWNKLTDADKKAFSVYMINRFISMDVDYIGIVNQLQQYNMNGMDARESYKVYFDLLPKKKFWSKYIKAKKDKDDKVSSKLIDFMTDQEDWSKSEAKDNISYLLKSSDGVDILKEYLTAYGFDKKDYKSFGLKK